MTSPSSPPAPAPAVAAGSRSSTVRAPRRRTSAAALALAASSTLLVGWSAAAVAQDPGVGGSADPSTESTDLASTDLTATTTAEVLDPVDEITVVDADDPALVEPDTSAVDDENRRFVIVVGGLVAVAVALALLTFRYWRVTKPVPHDPDADLWDQGRDDAGEAAALGRDDVFQSSRRRSRRVVAGADHADVDADWEPMATGEQERVSGQVPRATSRPSRADRVRALRAADDRTP